MQTPRQYDYRSASHTHNNCLHKKFEHINSTYLFLFFALLLLLEEEEEEGKNYYLKLPHNVTSLTANLRFFFCCQKNRNIRGSGTEH